MAATRHVKRKSIGLSVEQAITAAHTADEAIHFSRDDSTKAAIKELANGVRALASAVRALVPVESKGGAR